MNFTYKYLSCTLEYVPNDISIKLISYLIDDTGQLYIDPNTLTIDTFEVQLYKSSLPTTSYANYLSVIAGNAIRTKYNTSVGGYCSANSNIVTKIDSTSGLLPGLYVKGTNIPTDTILMNVRDSNSIELSNILNVTEQTTLSFSTNGWVINYSALDELVTIINFGEL